MDCNEKMNSGGEGTRVSIMSRVRATGLFPHPSPGRQRAMRRYFMRAVRSASGESAPSVPESDLALFRRIPYWSEAVKDSQFETARRLVMFVRDTGRFPRPVGDERKLFGFLRRMNRRANGEERGEVLEDTVWCLDAVPWREEEGKAKEIVAFFHLTGRMP